ncbi:tyrosine-type recombinase/integrase [Sphingopyxis sp.]|uniref:tyrosine-type recombinase/integrase n=1 Tax=Sphingopyxis sp. TaxID=1908224 RepID=UPI003D120592
MGRITKRLVEAAVAEVKDYIIWDDELPGFGIRVFSSGKRSYIIQYRSQGRSRRLTIGMHGIWTPEMARREARIQLGRVAQGEDPQEERQIDRQAITVKELCTLYLTDLNAGLIIGKSGRPKKQSTIDTDTGRIHRHIVPLIGPRRVRDLDKAHINKAMKDIMAGKTAVSVRTAKLRGKAIVRGGAGTAARTIGLLGGILTYAVEAGIIETNPAFGIRKPKDNVRDRRLSEAEYRLIGTKLRDAEADGQYEIAAQIIRLLALTGCRRSELTKLRWSEVDIEGSCLRLEDSKEGKSVRPVGLPVIECLQQRKMPEARTYVFPGTGRDNAFGALPDHWTKILGGCGLDDITPHVLRHSFASIANDLGFTETTVAALLGHAKGSVTGRYIHTMDAALIAAADTVAGYIQGLLEGAHYKLTAYALDHASRKQALASFLAAAVGEEPDIDASDESLAA